MTTTYTATKSNGETVTRRSDSHYVAASQRQYSATVRFHKTRDAARRAAGRYGNVYTVTADEAPATRTATGTCTVGGRNACGQPAVCSGTFSDGTEWACCADHATPADFRAAS